MPATETIPLTITPEAAAHVAELGLREPFEQMLEHARQTIPGLRSLEVNLQPPYDIGGGECVIIDAYVTPPTGTNDPREREFNWWKSSTYSPEVSQHFCLLTTFQDCHAR